MIDMGINGDSIEGGGCLHSGNQWYSNWNLSVYSDGI
jgi:hypothetical protein